MLHAVPEQQEEESSVLHQELISGLADVYQSSLRAGDRRAKKREEAPPSSASPSLSTTLSGGQGRKGRVSLFLRCRRGPAHAGQTEDEEHEPLAADAERGSAQRQSHEEPERGGAAGRPGQTRREEELRQEQARRGQRRQSVSSSQPQLLGRRPAFADAGSAACAGFSSEAELLAHLRSSYDSAVSGREPGLPAAAGQLLSAVKAFSAARSGLPVSSRRPFTRQTRPGSGDIQMFGFFFLG